MVDGDFRSAFVNNCGSWHDRVYFTSMKVTPMIKSRKTAVQNTSEAFFNPWVPNQSWQTWSNIRLLLLYVFTTCTSKSINTYYYNKEQCVVLAGIHTVTLYVLVTCFAKQPALSLVSYGLLIVPLEVIAYVSGRPKKRWRALFNTHHNVNHHSNCLSSKQAAKRWGA